MVTAATIAGGVAAAATAASAANSIYNSSQGGGGGSMSGAYPANPNTQWLGNLYGMKWDPKNGYVSSGAPSIFGGNERTYLQDLMKPNPLYQGAQDMATQGIDMAASMTPAAVANVGTGMNWLSGLVNAGPTDIAPIVAQRKYDLYNNTVPQLAEQYSGQTGTFGTDFLGGLSRASGQMEADLGAKQYDATEAWKTRVQQAAPQYAAMAGTQAALPISLGSDALALGTNLWNAQQNARPGNDVLRIMTALSSQGSPSQQGFYQPGYAPTSSTAGMMAGLGQSVPSIINALSGTGGAGGATSTSAPDVGYGSYYNPGASGFSSSQILGY